MSRELGYRVSDQQVMKSFEEIPQFQIDGKFSQEVAMRLLQAQGISPAAFEADQRRGLQISQLQNGLAVSAFVTPAEAESGPGVGREQREASWMLIPSADFAAGSVPDDAAVNAYYVEKNKSNFMTPDTVALKHIELKVDDIAAQVKVSADEALATYYRASGPLRRSGEAARVGTSSSRVSSAMRLRMRLHARKPRTSWPR